MVMALARYLVILFSLFLQNEASRILAVFPTPSISHQVVFRPLILELVNRGHEVIMLTTDPIFPKGQGHPNLTEIDVHDISYKTWREGFLLGAVDKGNSNALFDQLRIMGGLMTKVYKEQISTNEMQNLLKDKSKKFDMLLLESYFTPLLGLTHFFKNASVIQVSSLGPVYEDCRIAGVPTQPFLYPTIVQQTKDLSFLEKLREFRNYLMLENFFGATPELMKNFYGVDMADVSELEKNVDMVFVNAHPVWDSNRPVPPNFVYIGGIHQKEEQPLPQDLQTYLDSSKHGVIYVSFGTNVEPALFPPDKLQALTKAFSRLPFDVLMKWNRDELPGRSDNVKISKWLPQSDLLRHPKIKLFVTQGGLQSTDEAITAGVPLIGIPMLGDQWYNVEQYVHHKVGLRLNIETITEDIVREAIETVVSDTSYHDNIRRLRSVMHDQPQTPLHRAVWWTEYTLRHGGAKHLRSPAAMMTSVKYYEVEFISYLVLGLVLAVSILSLVMFYVCSVVSRQFKMNVKLKET